MNKATPTITVAAKKITHMVDTKGTVYGVTSAHVEGSVVIVATLGGMTFVLDNDVYTSSEMSTDRGVTFFTPTFESVSLYW